jgi:hypothetical protein
MWNRYQKCTKYSLRLGNVDDAKVYAARGLNVQRCCLGEETDHLGPDAAQAWMGQQQPRTIEQQRQQPLEPEIESVEKSCGWCFRGKKRSGEKHKKKGKGRSKEKESAGKGKGKGNRTDAQRLGF